MEEELYCPLSFPKLETFFDFSFAPPLLFYTYVPIIVLSLFFGLLIYFNDRSSIKSKLLLGISVSFSVWVVSILFQWVAVYARVVNFAWQILVIPETLIYIFSFLLLYSFAYEKEKLPNLLKLFIISVIGIVAVLTPTIYNIQSFDITNCEGVIGYLWDYVYLFEAIVIFLALYFGLRKAISVQNKVLKREIIFTTIGAVCFLGIFFISNLAGELTKIYEINLVGPLGLITFLAILSYLTIKFRLFNIRILGAQALVVALWLLVFALLFVREIEYVRFVVLATLVLTLLLGIALVRGVKREVAQREQIEKMAEQLKGLVHFISHEVKGILGKNRAVFNEILDNNLGPVAEDMKTMVTIADGDTRRAVDMVMNILSSSDLKSGKMNFTIAPFDLKTSVLETVAYLSADAAAKGLALETDIPEGVDFTVVGDKEQITEHVIRNLIDNSIKYTPSGSVKVSLSKTGDKVLLAIKDTGVGITRDDMERLFTEGGRGKDSVKVNVNSTGYGLFFAKGIIDAHQGRIWAESQGPGKGSQFYVELSSPMRR